MEVVLGLATGTVWADLASPQAPTTVKGKHIAQVASLTFLFEIGSHVAQLASTSRQPGMTLSCLSLAFTS